MARFKAGNTAHRAPCNPKSIATKIRAVKRMRAKVAPDMRPLFAHLLRLAADSARSGYCTRAGQEIRQAKKWATGPHSLAGARRRR